MREHAEAFIESVTDDGERKYAAMVLAQRTGERTQLSPPKRYDVENVRAAELRDAIDHEMMRGEPVEVASSPVSDPLGEHETPSRYSVSFLNNSTNCLLMARLDRLERVSGDRAARGSLAHDVIRHLTRWAIQNGLSGVTEADAEEQAAAFLQGDDSRELGDEIPLVSYFDVVEMAKRWSRYAVFATDEIPHVEELFTRDVLVDGEVATISARPDLVQVHDGTARIDDYKTGPHVPTQDQFERRMQTPLYAWVLADMYRSVHTWDVGEVYISPRLDYPIRRNVQLATSELGIGRFVENAVLMLRLAYANDRFPATPGSHCTYCPRPSHCPLPRELRPDAAIDDAGHAERALGWLLATEAQVDRVRTALRGYVARSEQPVTVGDMVATFRSRTRRMPDSVRFQELIAKAGEDESSFYTASEFSQFVIERASLTDTAPTEEGGADD